MNHKLQTITNLLNFGNLSFLCDKNNPHQAVYCILYESTRVSCSVRGSEVLACSDAFEMTNSIK